MIKRRCFTAFFILNRKGMTDTEKQYKTVAAPACAELTDRRSRFIGTVCEVKTEEEAIAVIADLRKRYWDARHTVYAYSLQSGIVRCSDDGEPQGTAGAPVLDVLQKRGLTDCLIAVTRYFGGILLGTGGLVHAYSECASRALDAASIVTRRLCAEGTVCCDYAQYGRLPALIAAADGGITDTAFADDVTLMVYIPLPNEASFRRELMEMTAGTVEFSKKNEIFHDFFEKTEE